MARAWARGSAGDGARVVAAGPTSGGLAVDACRLGCCRSTDPSGNSEHMCGADPLHLIWHGSGLGRLGCAAWHTSKWAVRHQRCQRQPVWDDQRDLIRSCAGMPSEVWRRCRLCQILRYSKIALASSMRVCQRLQSSSSACIRDQNDSIAAPERQSPAESIGHSIPELAPRWVNAQEANWVRLSPRGHGRAGDPASAVGRHAQRVGRQGGRGSRVD